MLAVNVVNSKIQERHKKRLAYLYIRQSTLMQVKLNTGSTEAQREMYNVALAHGFCSENIKVVEQDQAKSGASMEGREAFKEMLVAIAKGQVGAVICYS